MGTQTHDIKFVMDTVAMAENALSVEEHPAFLVWADARMGTPAGILDYVEMLAFTEENEATRSAKNAFEKRFRGLLLEYAELHDLDLNQEFIKKGRQLADLPEISERIEKMHNKKYRPSTAARSKAESKANYDRDMAALDHLRKVRDAKG